MTNLLVGFVGLMGSGKDTASQALTQRGFKRFAFADKLKESALKLDPYIPIGQVLNWDGNGDSLSVATNARRLSYLVNKYGWDKIKTDFPEVRRFLQVVGTESGRDIFGENCWVDIVGRRSTDCERVTITDVRFPNEVDFVRSRGGLVIKIIRDGIQAGSHPSEAYISSLQADVDILNNGTIEQLHAQVLVALDDFVLKQSNSSILEFTYSNYKGEIAERRVSARYLWNGETEYHPDPQWLLHAYDIDKAAPRDFAVKDISNVRLTYAGNDEPVIEKLIALLAA
jgi:hypothetical protein